MNELVKKVIEIGDSEFLLDDILDLEGFEPKTQSKILAQLNFRREIAEIDGVRYMRDAKRKHVYREISDGKYECLKCDTEVVVKGSPRPLHQGPFDGAGMGKVWVERVPYCPKCEEEPQVYSTPLRVPVS